MHGNIPGSDVKFWTEERIAELLRLAADGLSAALIANKLGTTRNAIIGKRHRLGVYNGRTNPTGKKRVVRETRDSSQARKIAKSRKEQEHTIALGELEPCEATDLPPEPNRPVISLQNLHSHHCRWPIGDPGSSDFGFCGESIRDDSVPYCTHHCRIAYVPINKRSVAQLEAYANA